MSVAKVLLALFVVVFNNTNASLDWVEVTSPLLPLAKSGSCIGYYSLTDSIWILGGHPGATNKVEYNRGTNNFIEHTDFSRSLKCYGQSSIQIDDTIYIFIDSGGSEYIATFNIASNTFIPEAIQKFYPNLRHFPCVTNIGTSYLLVLGGRSQYVPYTNYNDFSIYDLTMNQWINNGPPLTIPRNSFSCNVMNNMLYIIGGTICSSTADSCSELNSVEMINVSDINTINQQSWIILSDTLHSKKSSMRSVAYNDKIYVLGGITDSSQLSEVDLIDTNTNSITLDSNLIMAVDDTAAVVAGNTIYAFGGNTPTDTDRWQYSYLTENPTTYPSSNPTIDHIICPTAKPIGIPTPVPTFASNCNLSGNVNITCNGAVLLDTFNFTITVNRSINNYFQNGNGIVKTQFAYKSGCNVVVHITAINYKRTFSTDEFDTFIQKQLYQEYGMNFTVDSHYTHIFTTNQPTSKINDTITTDDKDSDNQPTVIFYLSMIITILIAICVVVFLIYFIRRMVGRNKTNTLYVKNGLAVIIVIGDYLEMDDKKSDING
eukprot:151006_1